MRWDLLGFSREYLAQRPLNSLRAFLDDLDLLRLFIHIGRVENRLQRVADMVIHLRNHAHLADHRFVPVPLVGKDHRARENSNCQIVRHGAHAADTKPIQQAFQQYTQKKNGKAKKKTYARAAQQGWRLQFSVHHTVIIPQ